MEDESSQLYAPRTVATEGATSAGTASRTRPGFMHWVKDRLGLSALQYAVPSHANTFWYTLGGIRFSASWYRC